MTSIEMLRFSPPDPLDQQSLGQLATNKQKLPKSVSQTSRKSCSALACLMIFNMIAPQIRADLVKFNSLYFQPEKSLVDTLTDVDVVMNKDASSAPWSDVKCFQMTIGNPYEDTSLYQTFVDKPKDEAVSCSSDDPDVSIDCTYVSSSTVTFYLSFAEGSISMHNNDLPFTLKNFRMPWSTQKIPFVNFSVYSQATCAGPQDSLVENSGGITSVIRTNSDSNNVKISSTQPQVCARGASNSLIVEYKSVVGFSRSGSGRIVIATPSWYGFGEEMMFDEMTKEDAQDMCSSDYFEVDEVSIDTFNFQVSVTYSKMAKEVLDGTRSLVFQCANFRNPIYQRIQDGFRFTLFDNEPIQKLIEKTNSIKFDGLDLEPIIFDDNILTLLPTNPVVNTPSEWALTLSPPIPLDTECYVKIYLPNDLTFEYVRIEGKGFFALDEDGLQTITRDYFDYDPADTRVVDGETKQYRSIQIAACKLESKVGMSPQGSLNVQNITTPIAIKSSDSFYVEIYKDILETKMIGQIRSGKYIDASQLQPGVVTEMSFTPRDTKVQVNTTFDVVIQIEHVLNEDGAILIYLPEALNLPDPPAILEVKAAFEEIYFSATEAEVLQGNKLRIESIFDADNVPPREAFPLELKFEIQGIQNQRAAIEAGGVTFETQIQFGENEFYVVDIGSIDTTFVATTTNIVLDGITVTDPVTFGGESIYSISFTPEAGIPADGYIFIEVPPSLKMNPDNLKGNSESCKKKVICEEVVTSMFPLDPESYGQITIKLKEEEFYAGVQQTLEFSGFTNPRNTEKSEIFIINSFDNDKVQQIGQGQGGNVQMETLAPVKRFSGTNSEVKNGAINTYTFSIKTEIPLEDGDQVEFTIPDQIKPPDSSILLNCQPIEGLADISCFINGQTVTVIFNEITYADGTGNFEFQLDNFKNPITMESSDPFYDIMIKDKDNFGVAQFYGVSNTITTSEPNVITIATLNQEIFKADEATTYTISFTPNNPIPVSGAIEITWPQEITVPETGVGCIVTTTEEFDGIQDNLCVFDYATNTVTITGVFGGSDAGNSGEIIVKLIDIINPEDNRGISGFSVRTYSDVETENLIDVSVAGLLVPKLNCDYPCKTCLGSEDPVERGQCTSCWTQQNSEYKYFMMDFDEDGIELEHGKCQTSCNEGYSRDANEDYRCGKCAIYCDQCQDLDRDYCLTCNSDFPYMVENSGICLEECQDGYYQSSEKSCNRCEAPCKACEKTANTCLSCIEDSDTPFLHRKTCISSCPLDYTDISNECWECESPCQTCFGAVDVCKSCDGFEGLIYLDGHICKNWCDDGYVVDPSEQENLKCVPCEVAQCKICDINALDQCLECKEGYYVYDGICVSECPTDYRVGNEGKACVMITINDLGIFYFPFLMIAAILCLIVIFGKCKKKAGRTKYISTQNTITALLAFIAFVLYCALIAQAVWSWLFGTLKYFWLTVAVLGVMVIFNIIFFILYCKNFCLTTVPEDKIKKYKAKQISKKDMERFREPDDVLFYNYHKKHRVLSWCVGFCTIFFTFKCNKMYYSRMYSFDMFKGRWTNGKYYRKFMTVFCILHMVIDALILCISAAGLYALDFMSNMLYITMIETAVLSLLGIILGLVELFKMKEYLKYNEQLNNNMNWKNGKSKAYNVSSGVDFMDKDSRQAMIKNLLGNVKNNQGMFLNNKLDELLEQFGDRRCKSCIEFGTGWDKTDDPRQLLTWPLTPERMKEYDGDYKFTQADMFGQHEDNVYADVKQKPEAHAIAVQGDQGQQDFMRQLHRKQGDLLAPVDDDDELLNRKKAGKRRGRKNKYYTAIDAEDDEEAGDGNEPSVDEQDDYEDNQDMMREQEQEEAMLRKKVEEERLKQEKAQAERRIRLAEAERLRIEAEKAEEEARRIREQEDEELRIAQEQEELQRIKDLELSRAQMQKEEEEERRRRELQEEQLKEELKKVSEQNRLKYEEEEALRKKQIEEENRKLKASAEDKEKKLQAELAEQRRLAQEEKDRLQAQKDAEALKAKQDALDAEELRKREEKESHRKAQEKEDEERRLRAAELADDKRRQKEEEDRIRKEEEERRRKEALEKDEKERQERIRREEEERAKRIQKEDERRAKLDDEERKRRERLEQEEKERLERLKQEEEERKRRLDEEEQAYRDSLLKEEDERRRKILIQEEEVRKRLQVEEEIRLKTVRMEEEKRLQALRDEEERRRKAILEEEELRQANLKKEEAERLRLQEEADRKRKQEEEDRLKAIEAENEKRRLEDEKRRKREADEAAKRQREEEERILKEKKDLKEQQKQLADAKAKAEEEAKQRREKERREMEARILQEQQEREKIEKEKEELRRRQKEAEDRLKNEKDELEREKLLKEAEELERLEAIRLAKEKMLETGIQADSDQRTMSYDQNRPKTVSDFEQIVERHDEDQDGTYQDNSRVIMQDTKVFKDFGKECAIQVPASADDRTFNVNDIMGDLEHDDKGSIVLLQDKRGQNVDRKGRMTNMRGYLIDGSENIIENQEGGIMFDNGECDNLGEVPAPFCLEKYNFNPHNLMGDFDYQEFDKKTNTAEPILGVSKDKKFFTDKRGRKVNKHGWLINHNGEEIVDKFGIKKFDRRQLEDGDFQRLLNYKGQRYNIKDIIGTFEKDKYFNILPVRSQDGGSLLDMFGRTVNEKGYLIDSEGNIIDRDQKKIFFKRELKNGEPPKIFLFTKFNISNITGDFELSPLSDPILDKDAQGNLVDRQGRRVNDRGYLIDEQGNIIDKRGKRMFDKIILTSDGEIPKVFRQGLLKSDSGSSLSRLMEEIEKNNPSEFNEDDEKPDIVGEMEDGNGDTSVDSMMEDTPANYNMQNQRFDDQDQEDIEAIPEEKEHNSRQKMKKRRPQQQPVVMADDVDELPKKKKIKKKKPKKKTKMLEYLMPTKREVSMADAYGGMAKGQFRREGVKYDKNRLMNRIKTPANIPGGRAQLEALASTVVGFNKPKPGLQNFDDNLSNRGAEPINRPPRPHKNTLMAQRSEKFSNDAGSQLGASQMSQGFASRRGLNTKNETRNINDLRNKRARGGKRNDGDFEQMFGKDIDKYLEESEWDIESYEKMSQFSRGSGRHSTRGAKLKTMEKAYLQRIESSHQESTSKRAQGSRMRHGGPSAPSRKTQASKKPPAFREFQDRFVDNPSFIHKGEILEFDTHMDKNASSQKKNQTGQVPPTGPMNTSFNSQQRLMR